MNLTRLGLVWVPPFTEPPIDLKFDGHVNVLIGPNASGKSTVLQLMAEYLGITFEESKRSLGDAAFHITPAEDDEEFDEFLTETTGRGSRGFLSVSENWTGELPVIYIGSIREGVRGILAQPVPDEYGQTSEECLSGSFSGSRAMCAARLLGEELWSDEEDAPGYPKRGVLLRAVEFAISCSKQVCEEVIQGSRLQNYITGPDVRGYFAHPFPNMDRITNLTMMGVNTSDIRNFDDLDLWETPSESAYREDAGSLPIYMGHLSSGTEGTLLWIFWLVLKMVHHYNFEQGWESQPAILLIDEIENHLHPTWQRRVIPALLKHFPGLQIFATTHSPFVVAGLKAGQVHVLKRDENGVVTAHTEPRDVVGWTADEILRGMMGVEEPTDQLTVDRAKRLRELREKDELSDQDEEELNRLRRQVNEDLLNKRGPLEAQRERYADLMQDFLQLRQNKLNQDGE